MTDDKLCGNEWLNGDYNKASPQDSKESVEQWLNDIVDARGIAPNNLNAEHQKVIDTVCERLDNIILYLGTRF